MKDTDFRERIVMQLELITSLVGRLAFDEATLRELITKGAKKPSAMVKIYNLCTGELAIADISREVRVNPSSVTRAVNRWEEAGILLKWTRKGSVYPIRLYPLRT